MHKTFLDLEAAHSVSGEELVETLRHYADIGADVAVEVVCRLIDCTPITEHMRADMIADCYRASNRQATMGQWRAERNYLAVMRHLKTAAVVR